VRRVAVDVGGTFTDVVAVDDSGRLVYAKALTTYPDPTEGFFTGLRKLGAVSAEYLGHGTTLATNALLTGSKTRTALITTRGFRDVLEIRRTNRRRLFDIYETIPPPLVPRDARLEVAERIAADGSVVLPLVETEVRALAQCIQERGFDTVAICYLFSFVNPSHELRTREILVEELPRLARNVLVSSEVLPLHREYERTSTTVVATLLAPVMRRYFVDLEARIREAGSAQTLLVMQNTGGLISPARAGDIPVLTLLSGPAGGATATAFLGGLWQRKRLLAFDMGGTSTDVTAIVDRTPDTRLDFEIGGYTVSYPSIDIHTIGAGGGSQASVDPYGGLAVGPESSGSTPGPVCYGRGGELPTVTDANLVLGYLDPEEPLGGEIGLDRDAAARAIERYVAKPLGFDVVRAAWAIATIVNSNMMHALRYMSTERGRDPREYVLVPFGGAGPVHGGMLARSLQVRQIIVPPVPGCTSALGILVADLRHELVHSVRRKLTAVEPESLRALVGRMAGEVQAQLRAEGVPMKKVRIVSVADLRYSGQAYELPIIFGSKSTHLVRQLGARFHQEHRRRYGHALGDEDVELVNLRMTGIGLTPKPVLGVDVNLDGASADAYVGMRSVHLDGGERTEVPVFRRSLLRPGIALPAPCVVIQPDATVFVPARSEARVDEFGSIVIRLE
jgi:N-methylhydantoinase A